VNGDCIRGGLAVPAKTTNFATGLMTSQACGGDPVYLMRNVPYSSGRVAGQNYSQLATLFYNTRLTQGVVL